MARIYNQCCAQLVIPLKNLDGFNSGLITKPLSSLKRATARAPRMALPILSLGGKPYVFKEMIYEIQ